MLLAVLASAGIVACDRFVDLAPVPPDAEFTHDVGPDAIKSFHDAAVLPDGVLFPDAAVLPDGGGPDA